MKLDRVHPLFQKDASVVIASSGLSRTSPSTFIAIQLNRERERETRGIMKFDPVPYICSNLWICLLKALMAIAREVLVATAAL